MENTALTLEEIARRGRDLYDRSIRKQVETEENIGRHIVIDINSGEFEIDEDGLAASRRLLAKHPDAALYGARVGYDAVYGFGGELMRMARP